MRPPCFDHQSGHNAAMIASIGVSHYVPEPGRSGHSAQCLPTLTTEAEEPICIIVYCHLDQQESFPGALSLDAFICLLLECILASSCASLLSIVLIVSRAAWDSLKLFCLRLRFLAFDGKLCLCLSTYTDYKPINSTVSNATKFQL